MTNQPPKLTFSYVNADEKSDEIIFNFSTKPPIQNQKDKPGIPLPKAKWEEIAQAYAQQISGKELKEGKDYTVTYNPDGCGVSIKMKAGLINPDLRKNAELIATNMLQEYVKDHPEVVPAPPPDEPKAAAPAADIPDSADQPDKPKEPNLAAQGVKSGEQNNEDTRTESQENKPNAPSITPMVEPQKPSSSPTQEQAQLARRLQEEHVRRTAAAARRASERAAKEVADQNRRRAQFARPTI